MGQAFSSAFFVPLVAFFLTIFGPDYGFWGLSGLMAVLFVAVALAVHNRPEEVGCHPDNDPRSLEKLAALKRPVPAGAGELTTRRLLADRDAWLIGLASGGVYIVLVGVISQLVPRLTALGLPIETAISYVMITALIGIPGAYAWGWVGQKLGTKPALVVYMLWWLVAVVLQMFEPKGAVLWASLLMIGFSLGAVPPTSPRRSSPASSAASSSSRRSVSSIRSSRWYAVSPSRSSPSASTSSVAMPGPIALLAARRGAHHCPHLAHRYTADCMSRTFCRNQDGAITVFPPYLTGPGPCPDRRPHQGRITP